ncbi:MAG: glycosyltransferase family 4 protein [Chloroflexia bacterium]|nr:glycosyltransferase family 4 protein [Chloroflexia bacterium]
MRILILSKALLSSAYRRKTDALAALPDVQLTVASPAYWQEPRAQRSDYEPSPTPNYQIEILPMRFNGQHHLHYYPTFGALVRRLRPDIVHVDEESFNLATFLALRAAHQVGARTCFYNYANIARRYPPPFGWFERYAFAHAQHALACSHEAAEIIRNHGYTGALSIIPQTGVDPVQFAPRPDAHIARQPFTIGYVGRLVPEKGIADLISALATLPPPIQLRIVGSGTHADALRQHAHAVGVTSRIEWHAPVASHAIPTIMHGIDALVLPSRTTANWKEQFGRVLVEAMACGIPVIGSDSGEIPHVIGDGGIVYPEGQSHALADAIMHLVAHPHEYADYSHKARQRVQQHYTQQALAHQYLQIYQQMLMPAQMAKSLVTPAQ